MAKVIKDSKTVERNKDIGEFIQYFYRDVVGIQPDTTSYAAGHKVLDGLMNNPDQNVRSYTFAELKSVVMYCQYMGVRIETLTIFHYPGLVSSIVNGKKDIADNIINRLVEQQQAAGIFTEAAIRNQVPIGW